ncbi:prolyl aminopeptidase [Burkholderia gladioli]|uniref:prolyl aminopeptidase n=1 Tax=Burkholderia gladioli TaxID=28095 RepID=UPI001FC85A1F|nr:prolyl aminopeptidase [Burkholderia gladioli]
MRLDNRSASEMEGSLEVADGHTMYWRACGNPDAPVVVILHGGPGSGHNPKQVQFFDLEQWRIVMFDQRGCGRSTPFASTANNTTADLVADMERLRNALGIERWMVFGGSWGVRLALEYGVTWPEHCTGFMLRGVFLGRPTDIEWFLWGAAQIFPDTHSALLDEIEDATGQRAKTSEELLTLCADIFKPEHPKRQRLAEAWERYESQMCAVQPLPEANDEALSLSLATLEHHYMSRVLPLGPEILERLPRITHLPCEIVHGRYDIVCPLEQAWRLAAAWPNARLNVATTSGHWPFEPEMAALLQAASARLLIQHLGRHDDTAYR